MVSILHVTPLRPFATPFKDLHLFKPRKTFIKSEFYVQTIGPSYLHGHFSVDATFTIAILRQSSAAARRGAQTRTRHERWLNYPHPSQLPRWPFQSVFGEFDCPSVPPRKASGRNRPVSSPEAARPSGGRRNGMSTGMPLRLFTIFAFAAPARRRAPPNQFLSISRRHSHLPLLLRSPF